MTRNNEKKAYAFNEFNIRVRCFYSPVIKRTPALGSFRRCGIPRPVVVYNYTKLLHRVLSSLVIAGNQQLMAIISEPAIDEAHRS